MVTRNSPTIVRLILLLTIVCFLSMIFQPPAIRAGTDLPPRYPPPMDHPSDDEDEDEMPVGAYIELQTHSVLVEGIWTVVQWQDRAGAWHEVEGWQGDLDADGHKRWWVAAEDFGHGPFRWIITEGYSGPQLAASGSFNLPDGANEVVQVKIAW